ncbi:uncharacterized protein LOC135842428 [Planococcus citri]|uniref:uncharacterized protein LOC135842428 n=1 Tax=Planococcus citri TaxID=170843 RepID=UPI0031F7D7D9
MAPPKNKKVQPISIQRIDLKRVEYRLKQNGYKFPIESNLSKVVKAIIKIHNDKKLEEENEFKNGKQNEQNNNINIEDDSDDENTQWQDENKGYRPGHKYTLENYSLIYYTFTKTFTTDMAVLSQLIPEDTQNSHHVVFFFKENPSACIFALTTGNAWQVTRPYIDYSFPIKIVEEVGDPTKIIHIARRGLFGNHERETSLRPAEYELYKTSHMYYYCESFQCQIKPDSKLYDLIKVKNKNKYLINVTTGGLLKIIQRLKIENFPAILDLFCEYTDGAQYGNDFQFEFLHFLKLASLQRELDISLIDHIYFKYKSKKDLPIVHLRHGQLQDFLLSNSFRIKIDFCEWSTTSNPPSIREIVDRIGHVAANENEFRKIFLDSELRFKKQTSKKWENWQKIIDCVEAEHRYSGSTYFKIRKLWYELMPYHLTLLEEDFINVVKNVLIEEGSTWRLHRPWTGNCKGNGSRESEYSRLYKDDDRCLVLDMITPDNLESCDIIKYTDDEVYLYQVKEKFGKDTREACCQIVEAATSIRAAITVRKSPTYLEKLYDMATTIPQKSKSKDAAEWRKELKSRVQSIGKDAFIDIFRNRKITFVYAYLPSDPNKSFANILRNRNSEVIEDNLIEKLKCDGFLDSHGRVTGKFLSITKENFQITGETQETNYIIYDKLEKRVLSKSTAAKIELVRLVQTLQSMNFDLKVCEIEKIPLEPQPGGSQTQTSQKIRQTKIPHFSPSKSQDSQSSNSVSKVGKNKKMGKINQTPEKRKQTKINDFFISPMKKPKMEDISDE